MFTSPWKSHQPRLTQEARTADTAVVLLAVTGVVPLVDRRHTAVAQVSSQVTKQFQDKRLIDIAF